MNDRCRRPGIDRGLPSHRPRGEVEDAQTIFGGGPDHRGDAGGAVDGGRAVDVAGDLDRPAGSARVALERDESVVRADQDRVGIDRGVVVRDVVQVRMPAFPAAGRIEVDDAVAAHVDDCIAFVDGEREGPLDARRPYGCAVTADITRRRLCAAGDEHSREGRRERHDRARGAHRDTTGMSPSPCSTRVMRVGTTRPRSPSTTPTHGGGRPSSADRTTRSAFGSRGMFVWSSSGPPPTLTTTLLASGTSIWVAGTSTSSVAPIVVKSTCSG